MTDNASPIPGIFPGQCRISDLQLSMSQLDGFSLIFNKFEECSRVVVCIHDVFKFFRFNFGRFSSLFFFQGSFRFFNLADI